MGTEQNDEGQNQKHNEKQKLHELVKPHNAYKWNPNI